MKTPGRHSSKYFFLQNHLKNHVKTTLSSLVPSLFPFFAMLVNSLKNPRVRITTKNLMHISGKIIIILNSHNFLSYLANQLINKLTKATKYITSLGEVTMKSRHRDDRGFTIASGSFGFSKVAL